MSIEFKERMIRCTNPECGKKYTNLYDECPFCYPSKKNLNNEDYKKEVEELKTLGYRIVSKKIKYIYSKGEVIGKKLVFEIEKKEITKDL